MCNMKIPEQGILLLSMDERHIKRIFSGNKLYELRKSLTKQTFDRVYLIQTGGGGIVGYFDHEYILHKPIAELWKDVKGKGIAKKRFDDYFGQFKSGYAIRIGNAKRFDISISISTIKQVDPSFRVPLSFQYLGPGEPLLEFFGWYNQVTTDVGIINLSPISSNEKREFKDLVIRNIGAYYDGIDDDFVFSLISAGNSEAVSTGFFTERKEVLTIKNSVNKRIGFSTLTYKSGGSVKTGPTILLDKYQGDGLGGHLRVALERRVLLNGSRKIYCTAPSNSKYVVRYLLKAGYKVEAHLERHYHSGHDELVFGKILIPDQRVTPKLPKNSTHNRAKPVHISEVPPSIINSGTPVILNRTWFPLSMETAKRIWKQTIENTPSNRPKDAFILINGDNITGIQFLLPKRGGAVKSLLALENGHSASIRALINCSVDHCYERKFRKIYVLHPLNDQKIHAILKRCGFYTEGLLRAPYSPGQDVVVYAKML